MLSIRKATLSDHKTLTEFQKKMALESENMELNPQTVSDGVKAVLEDPSKGFYHIAEDAGNIIACHMITFEWSDWNNGNVYWIQSLYVVPEFRKKGVFRKMYQHLQQLINKDHNIVGIRLYVDSSNTIAHKAYDAIGMDGEHYRVYEWMKA